MHIEIREHNKSDIKEMINIWNEVVEEGVAFPQEELLDMDTGEKFFKDQTYSAVAADKNTGKIYGLYILHPNNVGRCGHICNASYAVSSESRGLHIGEKLVKDCLEKQRKKALGYYSLTLLLQQIHLPDIYTKDLVFSNLEQFQRDFA